jgi:hypothetical protein
MILEEEREQTRTEMCQLIGELERLSKEHPGTTEQIRASVQIWEHRLFTKHGRDEYLVKVKQKRDVCRQEIDKHRAQAATTTSESVTQGQSPADLRERLEHCRQMLRFLRIFGERLQDRVLMDDFMRMFWGTSDILKVCKRDKLTGSEYDTKVEPVHRRLMELQQRIETRVKPIQNSLRMDRTEEILELEPFGLIEKIIDATGHNIRLDHIRATGSLIGTDASLKRHKSSV